MNEKEYKRIWGATELFLRRRGYRITLKQLEEVMPDIDMIVDEPTGLLVKVALVIHEAVEIEEVRRETGKWQHPRDYYDEVRRRTGEIVMKPHLKACAMEEFYLRGRRPIYESPGKL